MTQGTVKWFGTQKGYGLIAVGGGEDIFVHYSSITADGYKSLDDGALVEFHDDPRRDDLVKLAVVPSQGDASDEPLVVDVLGVGVGNRIRHRPKRAQTAAPLPMARSRTDFLIDVFDGAANLARILGVSRSQPSRWRKGDELPSPAVARLLLDLDHIVAKAMLLWPQTVAVTWLTSANAYLDGSTPIDVLRVRGVGDVIDALDAAHQGAFS